ncbi:MAG: GGDEF domain-containing protein [Mahellales bacterium]
MVHKRKDYTNQISLVLGEFKDKALESEYSSAELLKAILHVKPLVIVLGILYFLFIIPDSFIIENQKTFRLILANRFIFLLLTFILYYRLGHFKTYKSYSALIVTYEFIVSVFFLLTFYYYESTNFSIQTFGVIIIILAIFLVYNRLIYMVLVSSILSISFLWIASHIITDITLNQLLASAVYLILVIAFNTFSTIRVNYYKRIQYLNETELKRLATTDSLTGIYSRTAFYLKLEEWSNYAHRYPIELAMIMFDIDDFKKVNDTFGHSVGDRVLIQVVNTVRKCIRNYDVLTRWGGEEFVILAPNTGLKEAVKMATRIKETINRTEFETVGKVTCSFGVTLLNNNDNIDSFIARADRFLYYAKESGKNKVVNIP